MKPRDDNLRLVLSPDQDAWIKGNIRESQRYLALMCVLFLASILCFMVVFGGASSSRVWHDCARVSNLDQSLVVDGKVDGMRVCSPKEIAEMEDQAVQSDRDWAKPFQWLVLIAYPLLLGTPIGIFVNIKRWMKFRSYLKDHHAFLRAYNRY